MCDEFFVLLIDFKINGLRVSEGQENKYYLKLPLEGWELELRALNKIFQTLLDL